MSSDFLTELEKYKGIIYPEIFELLKSDPGRIPQEKKDAILNEAKKTYEEIKKNQLEIDKLEIESREILQDIETIKVTALVRIEKDSEKVEAEEVEELITNL